MVNAPREDMDAFWRAIGGAAWAQWQERSGAVIPEMVTTPSARAGFSDSGQDGPGLGEVDAIKHLRLV